MKATTINFFLKNDFLVNQQILKKLKNQNLDEFLSKLSEKIKDKNNITVLNEDLFSLILKIKENPEINWNEFEKSRALLEKGRDRKIYNTFLDILNYHVSKQKKDFLDSLIEEIKKPIEPLKHTEEDQEEKEYPVIVLKSYNKEPQKKEVQDFVEYYKQRYNHLKKILLNRPDLQNATSINRLQSKSQREEVTIIGIVTDKSITKNNNLALTLEDPTGQIKIIITNKEPIFESARDIVLDEVIGLKGTLGNKVIFSNNFFTPNIPKTNELKITQEEIYAAFIADIHVGSDNFLEEDFLRFIKWLNLETGSSEQKEIAKKIKYLFIVGDIVDGVGIYPGQEEELIIKDITEQYKESAKFLNLIRKDIKIILCAGNHDALRISEPQPVLDKELAKDLYSLKNITIVSNPALINIASTKNFSGVNVLLYHGYSYDYYAENVESIRKSGKHISDRSAMVMKFMLQRRHFAPTHASTLFVPDPEEDNLIIDKIPDIFCSGHIHKASISNYKNITLISASCWQSITDFQEKVGHEPDPSKVPILNLKTREVKIMNFKK